MAFIVEGTDTPTSIGTIVVILKDAVDGGEDGNEAYQSAHFQVAVLNQNGERMETRKGNLVPHITTAQKNALMSFMASLRTQAENQILP